MPKKAAPDRPPKRPIHSLETIGFVLLALIILITILIRYGSHIPWGAR